jgi:hypothetical protein
MTGAGPLHGVRIVFCTISGSDRFSCRSGGLR